MNRGSKNCLKDRVAQIPATDEVIKCSALYEP